MSSETLLEVIKSRRSIRRFKPDPVPDEVLFKILEAGIRAPTAGGGEQWFFIIVGDEEKRKAIHKLLLEAHKLYATKVLRKPLSKEKLEKWMKEIELGEYLAPIYIAAYIDLRDRLYNDEFYEFEKLMAIQSLAAAIENMLLAAHAMGLGAVWLGVPLLLRKEFDEILQPPEGCELQAMIALGYPAEEVKPKKRLKDLAKVVKVI